MIGLKLEGAQRLFFDRAAVTSAADRTARATEETAKNTKRLLEQSQHGRLVFT